MPYVKRKGGKGYVVYKKEGGHLKRVGSTVKGNIRKYMAALHLHHKKK